MVPTPYESLHHFHIRFVHLCFEYQKYEVDWMLLVAIFQYIIHISENPHELESFEPLPTYLCVTTSKSVVNKVVVPSDPSPSSHQMNLVLEVVVGKVGNSSVELPPSSPTPHTQNFSTSLDHQFNDCDEVLSPCPSSFGPSNPPDCDVLCSPISNLTCDVQEDQALDGVGVEQPTSDIIHNDYVGEPRAEQESATKDDSLSSAPLLHHPDISHDSVI